MQPPPQPPKKQKNKPLANRLPFVASSQFNSSNDEYKPFEGMKQFDTELLAIKVGRGEGNGKTLTFINCPCAGNF